MIPPRITPSFANPNQMLDWRRFSSDNLKSGYLSEAALIRAGLAKAGRAVPVTTNFMDAFEALDYFDWAKDIDLVTNDSYPDPADPRAAHQLAFTGDLMRGLGGGRPWLLMEQAPGAVQWRARNAVKPRGSTCFGLWHTLLMGPTASCSSNGASQLRGGNFPRRHGAPQRHPVDAVAPNCGTRSSAQAPGPSGRAA